MPAIVSRRAESCPVEKASPRPAGVLREYALTGTHGHDRQRLLPHFHLGAFSSCSSCSIASASSGLIGLFPQRGSVLCKAAIIARVTGSGAQPWSVSQTTSHCAAAGT